MQPDLKNISSADLVERLHRNTEYYMLLFKSGADNCQRKVALEQIELIIAEMKTREDCQYLFEHELDELTQTIAS